jgi:hypothetical protein
VYPLDGQATSPGWEIQSADPKGAAGSGAQTEPVAQPACAGATDGRQARPLTPQVVGDTLSEGMGLQPASVSTTFDAPALISVVVSPSTQPTLALTSVHAPGVSTTLAQAAEPEHPLAEAAA